MTCLLFVLVIKNQPKIEYQRAQTALIGFPTQNSPRVYLDDAQKSGGKILTSVFFTLNLNFYLKYNFRR